MPPLGLQARACSFCGVAGRQALGVGQLFVRRGRRAGRSRRGHGRRRRGRGLSDRGCGGRFRRRALGAHAAANQHAAQEDHDRHHGDGHEQKDQLLAVELYLVESVVGGCGCHRLDVQNAQPIGVKSVILEADLSTSLARFSGANRTSVLRDPDAERHRQRPRFVPIADRARARARPPVWQTSRSWLCRYASASSTWPAALS